MVYACVSVSGSECSFSCLSMSSIPAGMPPSRVSRPCPANTTYLFNGARPGFICSTTYSTAALTDWSGCSLVFGDESAIMNPLPGTLTPFATPIISTISMEGTIRFFAFEGTGNLKSRTNRPLTTSPAFIDRLLTSEAISRKGLASSGADVRVYKCDTASYSGLEDTLAFCFREMPPISGVMHSAFVLRDAILQNMTYTQWVEAVKSQASGQSEFERATTSQSRLLPCFGPL